MNEYDRAYYEVRGVQSRALAATAADPKMAAIHTKTAERYDALASSKVETSTGQSTAGIEAA